MRSVVVGLMAVVMTAFAGSAVVAQQAAETKVQVSDSPEAKKAIADREQQRADAAKGQRKAVQAEEKLKAETMAVAPKLVAAGNIPCQVTDAANEATFQKNVIIEVACQGGFGYLIVGAQDGSRTDGALDCIPGNAPLPTGRCKLPGNAQPYKALQPFMTKTGSNCAIDEARELGRSARIIVYEVACADKHGEILSLTLPRGDSSTATNALCLKAVVQIQGATCNLTTAEANAAVIKAYAAKSAKPCPTVDQRFVGTGQSGADFYEIACQDKTGYILQVSAKGEVQRTVPCIEATGMAGGCKLTDIGNALQTKTAEYTQALKASNFNCDVAKFESRQKEGATGEILEVTCTNQPGSVIALLNNNKATILPCPVALSEGVRCSMSKAEDTYPMLTAHLKTLGRDSCVVNGARSMGVSNTDAFIEVTCADGGQGFVVGYPKGTGVPKTYTPCSAAGGMGGCTLAGNKKG